MIRSREEEPTNISTKQTIRKHIREIDTLFTSLQLLQENCKSGKGVWFTTKTIPEDIKRQRDDDIILIEQHIQQLKSCNRKIDVAGKTAATEGTISRSANLVTVGSSLTESIQEELPTINISEGIKQINENKEAMNKSLDIINEQLNRLGGLAESFADELETQKRLLEKIDTDVQKYTKKVGTMNKRLHWAIKKVGGTTKLVFVAILVIVLVILFATIYIVIVSFVQRS